jgi:DNA-binding transcriptional MerR regulator
MSNAAFERYNEKRAHDSDPQYYRVWNELSLGALSQFWRSGGMSIGPFSKLVGLSVSCVRHYLKQNLLEPYKVAGKYRFHPFNIWEVRSVLHWQDMGLTLVQIAARRSRLRQERPGTMVLDVLGPLRILGEEHPEGLVWLRRLPLKGGWKEEVVFGVSQGEEEQDPLSDQLFRELTSELHEAEERLEQRLHDLKARLGRLSCKQRALGIQK